MNDNTLEFMKLSKQDRAQVITEMVTELAKETSLPLPICIAMIAEYKGWSIFQVEQYMKLHDSELYYQVAFYENGQKVYKHNVDPMIWKIVEKHLYKPIMEHPFQLGSAWIKKVIQDFFMMVDWNTICHKVEGV